MGIRQSINEHRVVSTVATISLFAIALILLVWQTGDRASGGGSKAFYTIDDGATWFTADADLIAPFEHEGKQAVMCIVYKCGEDGKPWVSHLMRYTAEGKQFLEDQKETPDRNVIGMESVLRSQFEVKKPGTGDNAWVRINDPRASVIQKVECPHGAGHEILPLDPNK